MTRHSKTHPRYTMLGAIHRGGMGEILLAQVRGAEGFERKVLLKGVLPELAEDRVSHTLFRREARLMARLEHPNIVRVFDVPEIDGRPYLAMEYVRGRNFHQLIQRAIAQGSPLPPDIAAYVVAQACRGLHQAHIARGEDGRPLNIVHRDISPGNILLGYHGEVKVTDFGIAKVTDAPGVTGPRSIRGKARYVAPEVIQEGEASTRSDIYSAGVVLGEALCGVPLFERGDITWTLRDIVHEPRSVTLHRIFSRIEPNPRTRRLLERALAIDPYARFDTALDFAEALDGLAHDAGRVVTPELLGRYLRGLFNEADDRPRIGTTEVGAVDAIVVDPTGSTPPPLVFTAEPVSYLHELLASTTDEEAAHAPATPALAPNSLEWLDDRLHTCRPWTLIIAGILIGAVTAIGGSLLALLTR